jgi:hypothetical protein
VRADCLARAFGRIMLAIATFIALIASKKRIVRSVAPVTRILIQFKDTTGNWGATVMPSIGLISAARTV